MSDTSDQNYTEADRGDAPRSVSPYRAGLLCRCPNCGEGAFFKPMSLDHVERCDTCGFDLSQADPGDGAQVFVIFFVGTIATLLGFFLIGGLGMNAVAALAIMFAVTLVASIWMLRVFKATLVALQFHHDASEGRLEEDRNAE